MPGPTDADSARSAPPSRCDEFHFRRGRLTVMGTGDDTSGMPRNPRQIARIGTFDGRAGSQDRSGRLSLADAMVDLSVIGEREDPETGERILELSAHADLPANEVEVRFELPEHGAERLGEALARKRD